MATSLDELKDAITEQAAGGTKSYTIEGRTHTGYSLKEQMEFAKWLEQDQNPPTLSPIEITDV